MPEIQKIWIFAFCRSMLFEMLSWNCFEFVFREIHFLKCFFLAVWYIVRWAFKSVSAANVAHMLNRHFNDMHWRNFQF